MTCLRVPAGGSRGPSVPSGVQARVAVDLARRLCRVGMDLEVRREQAQGLLDLHRAGAGGNGQFAGDQLHGVSLCRRETHESQSLRCPSARAKLTLPVGPPYTFADSVDFPVHCHCSGNCH